MAGMWHANDVGAGWWILMVLGMVAFWGLVIYGVTVLARGGSSLTGAPRDETPLSTAKRRLAAGEISIEEYEALRSALDDDRRHPVDA